MKTLHYVNAFLWTCNAAVWMFYAGQPWMAAASAAAAIGAVIIGRRSDAWDYR